MDNNKMIRTLIECGRQFYERGWMAGSAGNLSVKLGDGPVYAITPSGVNKGSLNPKELLTIRDGRVVGVKTSKNLRPSSDTIIHQTIYEAFPECGAVFHTHPIYSTLIAALDGHPSRVRKVFPGWFEMMKGVGAEDDENAPITILPNWTDVSLIARDLRNYLRQTKERVLPAVLLYNHGLISWGRTPGLVRTHMEVIEYVCQYLYLKRLAKGTPHKRPRAA
jgi:methylthioribulose-1-phosphate dehydratase